MSILSGVCGECGQRIWLHKVGYHTWQWLANVDDAGSWRCGSTSRFPLLAHEPISIAEPADKSWSVGKAFAVGGLLALLAGCAPTPSHAEGVIPTPWGWRPAPCCREYGVQGYQGRPPIAFLVGPLARALAYEFTERALAALPPPYPPPPPGARIGLQYQYGSPAYAPPPRAYGPPLAQGRPPIARGRGTRFPCPDGCPREPEDNQP